MLGLSPRAFYPAESWAGNKTRAAFRGSVTTHAARLPDTEEDQPLMLSGRCWLNVAIETEVKSDSLEFSNIRVDFQNKLSSEQREQKQVSKCI